ncbi:UDP-N-acetyl-D-glucosamine 6-dehydrogenase [subsurface metagenome]
MNSLKDFLEKRERICVVGLGYVGLPLAVLFSRKYDVIGFDINTRRIEELKKECDRTGEISKNELSSCSIQFTDNSELISRAKVVIVTVPTPIDKYNRPDLANIYEATKMVGRKMQKGAVVVYESTVYPGVTEEECVPILEKESNLTWKKDFFVGYSPERVNPGDREHTIDKIVKVVSGDCESTVDFLGNLYGAVIKAGVPSAAYSRNQSLISKSTTQYIRALDLIISCA